jgi:hypothetical protein
LIRNFFNEFESVKSFFSNGQLKYFEKEAYSFTKNAKFPNFQLSRESSVSLFDDKYNLIFIVNNKLHKNPEIYFLYNLMTNISFCFENQYYNPKAIYHNYELEKINSKIKSFFINLEFNPNKEIIKENTNSPNIVNNITSIQSYQISDPFIYNYDDYKDEKDYSLYWNYGNLLELKITNSEKKIINDLKSKMQERKINTKDKNEVISFLDEYFNFKESKYDRSRGFPNYGNTCYLIVGMQVLKVLRFDILWLDLFDFEDETFLNLFIIIRYWTHNTISNKNDETKLLVHFKSFINGFFAKNNFKDFKILKMNDSCSFILNLFNLMIKNKLGIDSLASDIENNLKDPEEDEELISVINYNNIFIRQLEIERPYLFSIYSYFITRDLHGNYNTIKPYFDVSEKYYNKYKNRMQNIFTTTNSTLYVKFGKVLIVKLKIENDKKVFDGVEHYFEVQDVNGKSFTYQLKAITYATGKNYGHTFCSCYYGKWLLYDDEMPAEELKNFKMGMTYTLNYQLVEN